MNIDTKRRVLTAAGVILGVVLGAIVTAMKFNQRPLWFSDEIKNSAAAPTEVPGLNKRKIVVNRNGATVWLRLESAKHCDLGEIDYIKTDLRRLKQRRLLLTVESIFSSATTPPLYKLSVGLKELLAGYDVNFVFPYTEDTEHYGIYLCTDVEGTNSCHGKPLADYTAMPSEIGPPDRVHFFTYFMLRQDSIEILNNSVAPSTQEELTAHLRSLNPPPSEAEIDSVVATVSNLSKQLQLRFAEIDVNESRIKLILKRLGNVETCANASRESIVGKLGANQLIRTTEDGISTDITEETKRRLENAPPATPVAEEPHASPGTEAVLPTQEAGTP